MLGSAHPSPDPAVILYSILRTDTPEGLVSVVVYLYREGEIASITTVATVPPLRAAAVIAKVRDRLHRFGAGERGAAALRPSA